MTAGRRRPPSPGACVLQQQPPVFPRQVPVPVNGTVIVGSGDVITSAPVKAPATRGANRTVTSQLAPGLRPPVQLVPLMLKSVPVTLRLNPAGAPPVFEIVKVRAATAPAVTEPKAPELGVTTRLAGVVELPVPVSVADTLPPGDALTCNVAERLPDTVGLNCAAMVQLAPAASETPVQVLLPSWNSAAL